MPLKAEIADHRTASALTGRGVTLWLGGFFCAIVLANLALTYFALRTLPGGVLENSWDASQNWNQRIAASRAQTERGWTAHFALETPRLGYG